MSQIPVYYLRYVVRTAPVQMAAYAVKQIIVVTLLAVLATRVRVDWHAIQIRMAVNR